MSSRVIDASDLSTHPALQKAIRAALSAERVAPEPIDPNHNPFGHVRLAPTGAGWTCGLCGRGVTAISFDTWRHT